MYNQLKLYILRLFASDLDSIIKLFTKLDAQLDAYIAKQTEDANSLNKMATQLQSEAQAKTDDIARAQRIKDNVGAITR